MSRKRGRLWLDEARSRVIVEGVNFVPDTEDPYEDSVKGLRSDSIQEDSVGGLIFDSVQEDGAGRSPMLVGVDKIAVDSKKNDTSMVGQIAEHHPPVQERPLRAMFQFWRKVVEETNNEKKDEQVIQSGNKGTNQVSIEDAETDDEGVTNQISIEDAETDDVKLNLTVLWSLLPNLEEKRFIGE